MINTIVNSFDIWTEAQGIKSRTRIKSIDNISLEGISRLKQLILELAVTGKLVLQDPKDEPASELLKKIAKKKERLIKEGKLKKEKPFPEFTKEGLSITLPQGWVFAYWKDIAFKIGDIDHKMPEQVEVGYSYISPRDFLSNNMIDLKGAKKISEEDYVNLSAKIKPELGDIIYPRYGTIGENRLVITTEKFLASYSCCIIKTMHGFIDPKYQFFYSISEFVKKQAKKAENKTTQANVGIKSIQAYIVPLPPILEQMRIVAKVDELLALCDKLEAEQFNNLKSHQSLVKTLLETLTQAADANELQAAWVRMSAHFDTLFCTEDSIDQLKQTILQLAVMGKLVKQDLNDEPASELLKKIRKEKGTLIKQVPSEEITEEEIPFNIPKSWIWAKPEKFSNKITDGEHFRPQTQNEGVYFLSAKDIRADGVSLDNPLFVSIEIAEAALKRCNPEKGDILIVSRGGTVGRMCTVDIDEVFCLLGSVILIKPSSLIYSEYLKIVMKSPHAFNKLITASGSTAQPAIYLRDLKKIVFPIAPLDEQRRIVKKVDDLFAICNTLMKKLLKCQDIKVLLSKTIVEKAVQ